MHEHVRYDLVGLKISGLIMMQCKKICRMVWIIVSTGYHLCKVNQYVYDNKIKNDRGSLLKPVTGIII